MLCLGFEPDAAGLYAQTDTLSYGGRPGVHLVCLKNTKDIKRVQNCIRNSFVNENGFFQ